MTYRDKVFKIRTALTIRLLIRTQLRRSSMFGAKLENAQFIKQYTIRSHSLTNYNIQFKKSNKTQSYLQFQHNEHTVLNYTQNSFVWV